MNVGVSERDSSGEESRLLHGSLGLFMTNLRGAAGQDASRTIHRYFAPTVTPPNGKYCPPAKL